MTGAEFIIAGAAVKAGTAVAKAATEDDPDVKRKMLELAGDSPAMSSAAAAFVRRQEVWQRVRLRILQPLAKFVGLSSDYFSGDFERDLQLRMDHIPEEHLRTPPTTVAVPAMIGLSYSLEDEALKDMYLNLIARATDDRETALAHPAFAEVIKQLSAIEAGVLLEELASAGPIVALNEKFKPWIKNPTLEELESFKPGTVPSQSTLRRHLIPLTSTDTGALIEYPDSEMWVDNWLRLGLIEVNYEAFLNHPDYYRWLDQHPEYLRVKAEVEARDRKVSVRRGMVTPTAFGKAFRSAVMPIEKDGPRGSGEA